MKSAQQRQKFHTYHIYMDDLKLIVKSEEELQKQTQKFKKHQRLY